MIRRFVLLCEECRDVGRVESSFMDADEILVVSSTREERSLDLFPLRDAPMEKTIGRTSPTEESTGRSRRLYSDPISSTSHRRKRITANMRLDRERLISGNSSSSPSLGFVLREWETHRNDTRCGRDS